jgi:hypothetical protein
MIRGPRTGVDHSGPRLPGAIYSEKEIGAMIRNLLDRGLAEGVAGSAAWLVFIR